MVRTSLAIVLTPSLIVHLAQVGGAAAQPVSAPAVDGAEAPATEPTPPADTAPLAVVEPAAPAASPPDAPPPPRWFERVTISALFALAVTAATAAVGASPFTAAGVIVARRAWTLALHADLRWPATLVDHWLATPAIHRRHHDEAAPAANFAPTLAWVDRLFGTWAPPR